MKPAAKKLKYTESETEKAIRLDLGAGKGLHTPDGFTKVDKTPGKDVKVVDLTKRWPWKTNSVDEVNCAMLIQYLTAAERVHFFNELYRVLKPGTLLDDNGQPRGRAKIITPMWSAHKAYIDLQAQWPPVAEGFFHTLNRDWRAAQNCADTSGLTCHFEAVMGYSFHPAVVTRNEEYLRDAASWWKEATQDLIAVLTKA
jgi:hypothetical protein